MCDLCVTHGVDTAVDGWRRDADTKQITQSRWPISAEVVVKEDEDTESVAAGHSLESRSLGHQSSETQLPMFQHSVTEAQRLSHRGSKTQPLMLKDSASEIQILGHRGSNTRPPRIKHSATEAQTLGHRGSNTRPPNLICMLSSTITSCVVRGTGPVWFVSGQRKRPTTKRTDLTPAPNTAGPQQTGRRQNANENGSVCSPWTVSWLC